MKKVLSIIFVVCLCASLACALTSCNKDNSTYTPTTTVTKEEWQKMFVLSTVTINGTYVEDGEETVNVKIANNQCVISVVEQDESFSQYMFYENGKWFCAEENNGLYYVDEASWIPVGASLELNDLFEQFVYANMYDEFTYDEAKKAYTYIVPENVVDYPGEGYTKSYTSYEDTVNIYVEDGKIVKIEEIDGGFKYVENRLDGTTELLDSSDGSNGVYTFTDYTETTIENFPTFCINHSFSNEWSANGEEHWHACQTNKCGEKSERGDHQIENGICTICGYAENE